MKEFNFLILKNYLEKVEMIYNCTKIHLNFFSNKIKQF